MSSYRPLTVAEAASIIAPKIGLTVADNRYEVITFLNRYRNLLYNRYERQRLFDDVFYCFCPVSFHNECSSCNPCDRCYLGFTLPPDMAGVVSAWTWSSPLRIRSSWREAFTGRAPTNGDFLDVVEVNGHFATERDLCSPAALQVYAESPVDDGKQVIIEAMDGDYKTKKLGFTLQGNGTISHTTVVRKVYGVSLPSDRCGSVTLSTVDDFHLASYSPSEKVPARKRYKIPGRCRHNVLVQGTRQFVDVYFDTDLVEVGDRLVLEFMGTYFKYYESSSRSEKELAATALANAYKSLDGIVVRDDGGRLPEPTLYGRPRRQLPGYNRYNRGSVIR